MTIISVFKFRYDFNPNKTSILQCLNRIQCIPNFIMYAPVHKWLQSISNNFAQLGWGWGTLYLIARFLARTTSGWARLVCYRLVAQPVPQAPSKRCRSAGINIIRCIDATNPFVKQFPRPPEVIAKRFSDGAMCWIATSNERFAGFLWIAHDAYDEDEVRCRYELAQPDRSVWDFDVYVEPAFRMGRTFTRLWDAANIYMQEQGIQWSFSRISAFNASSLSAHARFGLQPLCSACFLCIGNIQITLISITPFVHLSWALQSRPTLHLSLPNLDCLSKQQ